MKCFAIAATVVAALSYSVSADEFRLLTGVDAGLYPGSERPVFISPGPGFPGSFFDGDRLAGTSDVGPTVTYMGVAPDPFFVPNEFGALSFLFRRGSVPLGPSGQVPFMGIEFLGGPLLDLDGDLGNGSRSLVPVSGMGPVVIPDTDSFIDLELIFPGGTFGTINLLGMDATGNNEGAPGTGPDVATIVVTLAGTSNDGTFGPAINPGIDDREGTLRRELGNSGTLESVWQIRSLGYELWEDTALNSPSTGPLLGTLQYLGNFEGWLIERNADGSWPTLAGEGISLIFPWPQVDTSAVGNAFNTANGAAGGMATIANGIGGDDFTAPGNGGLPLADFGGDLGAYLDNVVLPLADADEDRVVYLHSAGFGINNSFDPVFADTVSYDAVIIAAGSSAACGSFITCDSNCDGVITVSDIGPFVLALTQGQTAYEAEYPNCDFVCNNDANGDGSVTVSDIGNFVSCVTGS